MQKLLYVSNVAQVSDLSSLEDLFSTVGDVKAQHLELIPESGHRMEFGVFEMLTEQQALDCVERFHGETIDGRRLSVVSQRPKARPPVAAKKGNANRRG